MALILTRLLCNFGASLFTRVASRFITVVDPNPGWKIPLVAGWSGMRGVVSLAAALSILLFINDSQLFPYRNLILFITFIVILVTLVFQGITLPFLIKKVNLTDKYATIPEHEQERIIRKNLAKNSLEILEEKYKNVLEQNPYLNNLTSRLKLDFNFLGQESMETTDPSYNALGNYQRIYLDLLGYQRKLLITMNRNDSYDEEIIRKYLALIDIEEFKLREKILVYQ